jgi:DNA-binding transcriptional LysR family regulator
MASLQWADRIGRKLKLRDLHVLFAVMQSGSMARAADRLAVSQPVVSQAVADLEHTLGVRLFDRGRRGVEPTIYAQALLNHGLAAFDSLRQGVKEIEFLADPTAGELRIGCPEWIAAGLLPAIIDRLSHRHPRLVFHVQQTVAATMEFRELRQRNLDLVLGRLVPPFAAKDLDAEVLYQERMAVMAGIHSRWARRRKVELAELLDEAWLLTPLNEMPGALVADAFRASGLEPPQARVLSFSVHLRRHLLGTGRYLTVLHESLLRYSDLGRHLKVLPVKLPYEPTPVAIVTLKNRTLSPVARLFIDCARKVVGPLAGKNWSPARSVMSLPEHIKSRAWE